MRTKQLWIDENEAVAEQLLNKEITEEYFIDFMKGRGFDQFEIGEIIIAIEGER